MAQPISYVTLQKGTSVVSSDGREIGTVSDVVADSEKDIFVGLEVSAGLLSSKRFVPAESIESMTDESVVLSISSERAESELEPPA